VSDGAISLIARRQKRKREEVLLELREKYKDVLQSSLDEDEDESISESHSESATSDEDSESEEESTSESETASESESEPERKPKRRKLVVTDANVLCFTLFNLRNETFTYTTKFSSKWRPADRVVRFDLLMNLASAFYYFHFFVEEVRERGWISL